MQVLRTVLAGALALCLVVLSVANAAPIIGAKADEGSDKWLVDDAEVVMVVNFKQAFKSDLLTKGVVAEALKKGLDSEKAKEAIKKMGMDPTKDMDSMILSAAGFGDKAKMRMVLQGKFDKDKLTTEIKKNDKITVSKVGGVEVFEMENAGKTMYGVFANKGNFFVLTESKEATAELAKNGATKAAKRNKDLAAALKKFTGKEAVAMAMVVTDEVKKQAEGAGNPAVSKAVKALNSVTFAVTVTSGVDINLVGNTKDGEAKALQKQLSGLKGLGSLLIGMQENIPMAAKDLYEDIKIDNTRDTVTVSLKITKETIEKLAKMGAGGDK